MSEVSVESSRGFPGVRTGWVGCLVRITVVEIFAACRPDLEHSGLGFGTGSDISVLSKSSGVASGVDRSSLSTWEAKGSDCSIFSSTRVSGRATFSLGRSSSISSVGGSVIVGSSTVDLAGSLFCQDHE